MIGFDWLVSGVRAMCLSADNRRNTAASLKLAREQAAHAEDAGDTASADFWRDVEDVIINERKHPELRG